MSTTNPRKNPTDSERQPVPFWIKVCGAVVALAIVVSGLLIVNHSDTPDTPSENTLVALENQGQPVKPDPALNDRITDQTVTDLPEPLIKDDLPDWQQSHNNSLKIETLEKQLTQSQVQAESTQQQLKQLNGSVKDFRVQLNALQQTVLQLKHNAEKKKTVANKKTRLPVKPKIPFTLVSIDVWGDQLNAVVRHNGQIRTLRQGAKFQGWIIESINIDGESVIFKNPKSQKVTLKVNGV